MTETASSSTNPRAGGLEKAGETPALQDAAGGLGKAAETPALHDAAGEVPAVGSPTGEAAALRDSAADVEAERRWSRRKYVVLLAVVTVVVALDQWTKYLAVAQLTNAFEHHDRRTLVERIGGFFSIRNLDNDPYDSGRVDHRKAPAVVVPQYWHHRYVENPGAAWGFLSGTNERFRIPFFHVVSLVAILFIALFYRRLERGQRLLAVALSFVLGGAIGNYIDRIARNYVIDFVDWHWRGRPDLHWPTFNVADVAISVGVVLMLVETFFLRPESESGMTNAGTGVVAAAPESGGPGGEQPASLPGGGESTRGAERTKPSDGNEH